MQGLSNHRPRRSDRLFFFSLGPGRRGSYFQRFETYLGIAVAEATRWQDEAC
jgi:hypothetical protein